MTRLATIFEKTVVPLLRPASRLMHRATVASFTPINFVLSKRRRQIKHDRSVLHISAMVHIPYYTTRLLRRRGWKADYLALGTSPTWNESDFCFEPSRLPMIRALEELWLLWTVVAKYEIVHLHFAMPISNTGWELAVLKRLGRKVIIHYRGCEIRDRELNQQLHPDVNICQECDYRGRNCSSWIVGNRRQAGVRFGDAFLVTTPDLKDFVPDSEHLPFFAPENVEQRSHDEGEGRDANATVRIVHATNHPGIEGTRQIQEVVARLNAKGLRVSLEILTGVSHQEVLEALNKADLSIGKMKMGYYANLQVESLCAGVPAVTWVRPDLMTEDLRQSGFIFSSLDELEATLERLLRNPEELQQKRRIARSSILAIHDNDALVQRLIDIYDGLLGGQS